MDQVTSYFDFKNEVQSYQKVLNDKVDFFEIYLKKALEELSKVNSSLALNKSQFDKYVKETESFNDWYFSQNIFKKLWWNIKKYDYKHLKQIKENENVQY